MSTYATVNDLYLFLENLLTTERREKLNLLGIGPLYLKRFQRFWEELQAQRAPAAPSRAFSDELSSEDARHDNFYRAIWHLTQAYAYLPDLPDALREAAQRIQQLFVPSLDLVTASYADEAARSKQLRTALTEHGALLALFPVVGGADLQGWVEGWLKSGESLASLLEERAKATQSASGNSALGVLRGTLLGAIHRCRAALVDELVENPSLPRDLDAQIFGYFDELTSQRARRAAASAPNSPEAPASAPVLQLDGRED